MDQIKTHILLVSVFFASSCSMVDDYKYSIDPRLKPFVDKFFNEGIKRGKDYRTKNLCAYLRHIGKCGETIGMSAPEGDQNVIFVDIDYYNSKITYDTLAIEYAVFHELGHALLNRGHILSEFSIMDVQDWNSITYSNDPYYRKRLIDEMFSF